ncbi:MAG: IMP cyclohydrolase [Desulfarculales bacterium]|jgi:phosphoribosylaminoimidazolecarboxamide formyltransferase/IMP cyclohydrolase|nr:IMP cyclohydrolase [Desulfarculales bacterium]
MSEQIKRALLSVTDKSGILELARGLSRLGIELISTGGTAQTLRHGEVKVKDVAEVTGFPEILDGRVKTLHPRIHGGILARRGLKSHGEQMLAHNIVSIDLVCVNLYRFHEAATKADSDLAEAVENIDIGGPCLIRAAAKNCQWVTVLTDPADYPGILKELQDNQSRVSLPSRLKLAAKAFRLTQLYDGAIAEYMQAQAAAYS